MKQSPVSVDAGGRQALSREVGSKEVCVLLGLHKDQSPLLGVALRVLHQFFQLGAFVKLGNLVEILYKYLSISIAKFKKSEQNFNSLIISRLKAKKS